MLHLAAILPAVNGAILALDFSDGIGTTSVDQYTGIAGNGWLTPWVIYRHTGIAIYVETVTDAKPLSNNGGNYLQVRYSTAADRVGLARYYRKWDTSAISLDDPLSLEFDFRSNADVSSGSQSFTIFGSSSTADGSYWSDQKISFLISTSGAGWAVNAWDGDSVEAVPFAEGPTGRILAGDTWHFKLTFNLTAKTWDIALTKTSDSGLPTYTATGLALRPTFTLENLSTLNFNAEAPKELTNRGFDLDAITISSSSIPEAGTVAFVIGGVLFCAAVIRRLYQNA